MSLDYTALFTDLGQIVRQYDEFGATAAGLDTSLQSILDAFQADNQDTAADGLAGTFKGWKKEYASRRSSIAKYATKRLQDRSSVLDEVGATSTDINQILAKLIMQMQVDNQTVNAAWPDRRHHGGGHESGQRHDFDNQDSRRRLAPGSLSGVTFAANNRYKGLDTELCSRRPKRCG
jgi:hypothetical protein